MSRKDTPKFEWVRTWGGEENTHATSVIVDRNSDVLVAGSFKDWMLWGQQFTLGAGSNDMFWMKLSPKGELRWLKTAGGTEPDSIKSLAQDREGNIYMAGRFSGMVSFGKHRLVSAGKGDAFLVRLGPDGEIIWVKQLGGPGEDYALSLALGPNREIYFCGLFFDEIQIGTDKFISQGFADMYAAKLNREGELKWFRPFGGPGTDIAHAIAVLPDDGVVFGGRFDQTVDFGSKRLQSRGGSEGALVRLDSDGNTTWARRVGGATGPSEGYFITDSLDALDVDPKGMIYIAGTFSGTSDFGEHRVRSVGKTDAYVSQLDFQGKFNWVVPVGGPAHEQIESVKVDGNHLWITGGFQREASFGTNHFTASLGDGFLLKISADGRTLNAAQLIGRGITRGSALAVGQKNELYIAGLCAGPGKFGSLEVEGQDEELIIAYTAEALRRRNQRVSILSGRSRPFPHPQAFVSKVSISPK